MFDLLAHDADGSPVNTVTGHVPRLPLRFSAAARGRGVETAIILGIVSHPRADERVGGATSAPEGQNARGACDERAVLASFRFGALLEDLERLLHFIFWDPREWRRKGIQVPCGVVC